MQSVGFCDHLVSEPIDDTIERLEFSQNSSYPNYLCSVGWDCKFRLWDYEISKGDLINKIKSSKLILNLTFEDPIFSLCWRKDSLNILTGTSEGSIKCIDIQQESSFEIANINAGIKEIVHLTGIYDLIITASYDGFIHFWDLRDYSKPIMSYNAQKTIYSMAMKFPLLVISLYDNTLQYFNLNKLNKNIFEPELTFETGFQYPITSIGVFENGSGFACGSFNGRISFRNVDFNKPSKYDPKLKKFDNPNDFNYRCHRKGENNEIIYPIYSIKTNPVYGTYASCGGDGLYNIWDHLSRTKLKTASFPSKIPITAINYSMDGNVFAYSGGYDWSSGFNNSEKNKNTLLAISYLTKT